MRKKLYKFFLFFIYLNSFIYSQTTTELTLQWEEAKGAKAYQVQVKNSQGEMLVDEKVKSTEYKIKNLREGTYEHRVGVYNKFEKLSGFSEWEKIFILPTPIPEVTSTNQYEWEEDSGIKEMKIEGKNFHKNIKVSLYSSSEREFPIQSLDIGKKEMTFSIDTKNFPPDSYTVLLESPRGKSTEIKDFIKLKDFIKITKKPVAGPPAKKEVTELPQKDLPTKKTEEPKEEKQVSERYPYWKEAFQSSLLPGYGQWNKDHKIKSIGFATFFWGSVFYYFSAREDFQKTKKRYDQRTIQTSFYPILQHGITTSLYSISENESFYKKTLEKAEIVQSASSMVAFIYALNILDALFWKTSKFDEQSSFYFKPTVEFNSFSTFTKQIEVEYKINWVFRF